MESFKYIVRQKIITNFPMTIADLNNAVKKYGPDIAAMKGKNTRQRPKPVKWKFPKELKVQYKLILSMDCFLYDEVMAPVVAFIISL